MCVLLYSARHKCRVSFIYIGKRRGMVSQYIFLCTCFHLTFVHYIPYHAVVEVTHDTFFSLFTCIVIISGLLSSSSSCNRALIFLMYVLYFLLCDVVRVYFAIDKYLLSLFSTFLWLVHFLLFCGWFIYLLLLFNLVFCYLVCVCCILDCEVTYINFTLCLLRILWYLDDLGEVRKIAGLFLILLVN